MAEWEPTGRSFDGPTATWVEVVGDGGLHTALVLHPELRRSFALDPLMVALGFLEDPGVAEVAPLVDLATTAGRLVYCTGPVWPLGQLLPVVASGLGPCPRAACELVAGVARALDEAAQRGAEVGLVGHGALQPWRLFLDLEGMPGVIGYGLPALERAAADTKPGARSWRYCPPEVVDGASAGFPTDVFSLFLIAAELAAGRPVYRGDDEDVRMSARGGRARDLVSGWSEDVGPRLCEALEQGLRIHPDGRWPSGARIEQVFDDLLASPRLHGPGLAELVGWAEAQVQPRPRPPAPAPAPRVVPRAAPPQPVPRWSAVETRPSPKRLPPDHNAMYPHDPQGPNTQRMRVRLGDEQHWARIDRTESLAKSAARLVDQVEVSPVDLCGRIRGWYRIAQGDAAWFGDARSAVLDPDLAIELDFVPNRVVRASVVVENRSVHVEVGTAVHAQFLVGELRRRLGLAGTSWFIEVHGARMDPWQILDDWEPTDGVQLTLRRARRTRQRQR